ncbi:uncharacterized protein EV420DRAFT_1146884 [Desarmillaria tabescens]|uniref:F-box domain-containing protein n=1 Tax=Armillaria tabescens TaxID=1929756 RepID=A0AA39NC72_ARMTA|nr:uncharacterized protein EV420DRAFT_1146884 [Desarmillaria tabescens]KAK0462963.1 hypothetical protein EV420DRAFT_1146884 [Desarmillaria tabescens]
MVELPQELIEKIIDIVSQHETSLLLSSNPIKSLKSCALVARAFRFRSQYHLFHDVSLLNTRHYMRFLVICEASPHIPSLVRSLHLAQSDRSSNVAEREVWGLRSILSGMVNLRSLRLFDYGKIYRFPYSSLPPSLTSIEIRDVEFYDIDDLCALLNCHPRLRTLKLGENISIRASGEQDNMELKHNLYVSGPCIETLDISAYFNWYILQAVMENSCHRFPFDLHHLRNLTLAVTSPNVHRFVAAIMTPVARSIERLELNIFKRGFSLGQHGSISQSNPSLPSLPRLRSISIYYESPNRSLLGWIASNIFRRAPTLQEITLTVSLLSTRLTDGHIMIDGEGIWMRLDVVIAAHPTIQSFVIDLSVFRSTKDLDWREMMTLSIQKLLPATVAREIMFVSYGGRKHKVQ